MVISFRVSTGGSEDRRAPEIPAAVKPLRRRSICRAVGVGHGLSRDLEVARVCPATGSRSIGATGCRRTADHKGNEKQVARWARHSILDS
jgi:hypothetical protein